MHGNSRNHVRFHPENFNSLIATKSFPPCTLTGPPSCLSSPNPPRTQSFNPCYNYQMARTKQTAKKSTGGPAKRKLLVPSLRVLHSHSTPSRDASHSPGVTPDVQMAEMNTPLSVSLPLVQVGRQESLTSGKVGDVGGVNKSRTDDVSYSNTSSLPQFDVFQVVSSLLRWE